MTHTGIAAIIDPIAGETRKAIERLARQPLDSANYHYFEGQVSGLTTAMAYLGAPDKLIAELCDAAYEAGKR